MFNQSIAKYWDTIRYKWLIIPIGLLFLTTMVWAAGTFIPDQIDWVRTYRPATRELLALQSPYYIETFVNPPWVLLPLIPFAALPDKMGNGLLFVVSLFVLIIAAGRIRAKPLPLAAFLLSFPVIFLLLFGQIDWMILLGFTLPPPFSLLLVLSKPQIALPFTLFCLVEAWRSGGVKQVIRVFLPVVILYGLSFVIFGNWLGNANSFYLDGLYNYSLWPAGIPIGLALLIHAIRTQKKELSIIAGVFFSPYVGAHSWSVLLFGLLPLQWEILAASVGSWGMYLFRIIR